MKINFEIDDATLKAGIERTIVRVRRERRKIVKAEAEEILQESLAQVPVDTGTLKNSAYIREFDDGSYEVGYGKGSAVNPKSHRVASDYMLAQHENSTLTHPIGKDHFLSDPVREHQQRYEAKMARKMSQVLGGSAK